jgi:eukaryotic-like serine/threonine-protein kinase
MSEVRSCPGCGTRLSIDSTETLCPQCFLKQEGLKDTSGAPSLTQEAPTLPFDKGAKVVAPIGTRVRYFGDYELREEIARGAMGVVYQAWQVSLKRLVALKMILAGQFATPSELRRFHVEAEAAANLDHPHIVSIYEIGEHEGQHYFSMKLMEGGSLSHHLPRFTADLPSAVQLLVQVSQAVHYAHQRGVLHRDLKPSNILLDAQGKPAVADFGLAKFIAGDSTLTGSGQIMGTPSYMSPEQASGQKDVLTTATDVYSLGAILYQVLTGQPPFKGTSVLETMQQVQEREPEHPRALNPRVDRDLETICLKCLEKQPQRRYASAEALAEDLERWLKGEPIQARPVTAWEQGLKWVRRRPAIAALMGSVVVITALGFAGITWQWQRAETARREAAEKASAEAEVREEVETSLCQTRLAWAQQEWQANNLAKAEQLLDDFPPHRRGKEWRYLKRLCHADLLTLQGKPGIVVSVDYSPDGRHVASASEDRNITVWDVTTGKRTLFFEGHTDRIQGLAFSPDGQYFATASKDQTVKVWKALTGKEVHTLRGHQAEVLGVAYSPDGHHLASASGDGTVKIWDALTGKEVQTLRGHRDRVLRVAFSPDRKHIASGSRDQVVKVWDVLTGKETLNLTGHKGSIHGVAYSPDGRRLASASGDGTVIVWDALTGEKPLILRGHNGSVHSVAFSPDGKRLASAGKDEVVRVWDASTGREILTLRGHTGRVNCVAFSPDGQRLASASWDETVKIWDATLCAEEFEAEAGAAKK